MQVERGITVSRVKQCFDVDPSTGEMTWKWRDGVPDFINKRHAGKPAASGVNAHGYLRVKIDGVRFGAHRVAYALYHGEWPKGDIDHINGDRAFNAESNLRDVKHSVNLRNSKKNAMNTSGINGVGFHKASGKYRATVTINKKQKHLGLFDSIEDAVCARMNFNQSNQFTERHGE